MFLSSQSGIMLARQLQRWSQEGLISHAQADAIREYERAHDRPWLHWAAFGVGGLAIFLGLAALVASNWADIPDAAKLTIHLALNALAAWGVVLAWRKSSPLWIDIAVFLFSGSILTAIALTGQVFQLSAPLWQAVLFWLLLISPILKAAGQGKLSALTWATGFLFTVNAYILDLNTALAEHWATFVFGAAAALIAIGCAGLRTDSSREFYWRTLIQTGLIIGVMCASYETTMRRSHDSLTPPYLAWTSLAIVTMVAGWMLARAGEGERPKALILTGSFLAVVASHVIKTDSVAAQVMGAVTFIGLWTLICFICFTSGRIALAKIAVGIIAARLIIVYFEVFGSLALTGIGLIVTGVLVIGTTTAALSIIRRVPPARADR
jgi:uncharacterized membrane protein